jgi:PadR family transcriptional regulator PadR
MDSKADWNRRTFIKGAALLGTAPLLRRLETQGLLVSEWREEDKRNKRFYHLSADGKWILKQLLIEWKRIHASLEDIF